MNSKCIWRQVFWVVIFRSEQSATGMTIQSRRSIGIHPITKRNVVLVDNEIFSYSDNVVPIVSVITALLNAVGVALQPKSNLSLEQNEKNWDILVFFTLYKLLWRKEISEPRTATN